MWLVLTFFLLIAKYFPRVWILPSLSIHSQLYRGGVVHKHDVFWRYGAIHTSHFLLCIHNGSLETQESNSEGALFKGKSKVNSYEHLLLNRWLSKNYRNCIPESISSFWLYQFLHILSKSGTKLRNIYIFICSQFFSLITEFTCTAKIIIKGIDLNYTPY